MGPLWERRCVVGAIKLTFRMCVKVCWVCGGDALWREEYILQKFGLAESLNFRKTFCISAKQSVYQNSVLLERKKVHGGFVFLKIVTNRLRLAVAGAGSREGSGQALDTSGRCHLWQTHDKWKCQTINTLYKACHIIMWQTHHGVCHRKANWFASP